MFTPEGDRVTMFCQDFIFTNSKSLFVEYIDIIRAPYFSFLSALAKGKPSENSIFDYSKIINLSTGALGDFYYNRRNQNFLYDLVKDNSNPDYDKIDGILDKSLSDVPELVTLSPELNFVDVIRKLMWKDSLIAKKVYIYYPFDNPVIKKDVQDTFSFNVDIKFISGKFEEVLEDVPSDSTYVFSDITKMTTLADMNRLQMSTVLIPKDYGYNYENPEDRKSELLVNIKDYATECMFHFSTFSASYKS
jgi:hypothetical protein